MKLKGVLSGKFTPRSLGLKNTDRNSKVSDVVLCYRNRFDHTLKTLIKDKETKNFSESGIHIYLPIDICYRYTMNYDIYIDPVGIYNDWVIVQ